MRDSQSNLPNWKKYIKKEYIGKGFDRCHEEEILENQAIDKDE